jgi:hypothetical protein
MPRSSGRNKVENAEGLHGAQRVGGVGFEEHHLQEAPQFGSARRQRRHRGQGLLDLVFGGGAEFQSVLGEKEKRAQQHFGIANPGGLAQGEQPIGGGKLSVGEPRANFLKLARKRRPAGGNFLEKLGAHAVNQAGVAEVNAHPVFHSFDFAVGRADFADGGVFLRQTR